MRFSEFILTALQRIRKVTYSPAGSKDRGSPKKLLVDQRADPSSEPA